MRDFQFPSRSVVISRNASVATSHPRASLAAIDILREGGNAMDAAVAAGAVLTVVEPHMTSLGGDCFCIVFDPETGLDCVNGSGRAAKNLDVEALVAGGATEIAADSIHAVTAPGAVAAWDDLLSRHGRLGFDRVLAPAIDCAETGTPVAPRVAADWRAAATALTRHDGTARHYLKSGHAPREGEIMAYPALAATLREIAAKGRSGFYEGWVAEDLLDALQAEGSALTDADFAAVTTDPSIALRRGYRGVDVLGFAPNTQGFAVLLILGILERFGPWTGDPLAPRRLHVFLEAVRRAYAVRNRHLADPEFMELTADTMVGNETIDRLAATIDLGAVRDFGAAPDLSGSHTVYVCVVDGDGRAVSLINSLFGSFGSMRTGPRSGVLLHNRGHGFTLADGHPNRIAPGKRPLHTLIPGMVMKDGAPLYCYGVMGGAYQAAGHAYVLSNMLDYGMDPQAALDLPRLFLQDSLRPGVSAVTAENRVPVDTISTLAAMGHDIAASGGPIGGGQIIAIDRQGGVLIAGSDPRKDGLALGY